MIHTVGYGQAVNSSKWDVFKAQIGAGRIRRDFQPFTSGFDVGFRYLPFVENFCTT